MDLNRITENDIVEVNAPLFNDADNEDTIINPDYSSSNTNNTVQMTNKAGHKLKELLTRTKQNRREIFQLSIICCIIGVATNSTTINTPFYPNYAEDVKHVNSALVGVVIGMGSFLVFIFQALMGIFINVLGIKFLYLSSSIIFAVNFLLMSLLPLMLTEHFIIYSFIFIVFQSYSLAGISLASYSIGVSLFPNYQNTAISIIDFVGGIGYITGPIIGGELYHNIGYTYTFVVTGIIMVLILVLVIFILPWLKDRQIESEGYKDYLKIFQLLKKSNVLVIFINNILVSVAWSILYPTYGPFLKHTYCTRADIRGYAYSMGSISYTVTLPFIGYLTDKIKSVRIFIFIGLLMQASGLLLTSPIGYIFTNRPDIAHANLTCSLNSNAISGLPATTQLLVISFIGQLLLGSGSVFAFNPSYPDFKKHTSNLNMPSIDERLIVLRGTSYYLGDGFGPIISSFLINYINFDQLLIIFIAIQFLSLILVSSSTAGNFIAKMVRNKRT